MPSTTVHIPDEILSKIDKLVRQKKISRNRFIIEACESALKKDEGEWPKGFFDELLNDEDRKLLAEAGLEMESAIMSARRNRNRGVDL
jgi:predicted transcriptional regulator